MGAAAIFVGTWDPDEHWATASMIDHVVAEEVSPDDPGGEPPYRFHGPLDIEGDLRRHRAALRSMMTIRP
jgi:hypothetical protein